MINQKLNISLAGCLAISSLTAQQKKEDNPNIIVILADDMGWGDLHCNGNLNIHTPNLDKLASESMVIDRFYVSPLSAPTRASLLTGRYFLRTGASFVTDGLENMHPDELTIAQILKQQNYTTGCFGKWHNGLHYPQHPNRKGFDEFVGFCNGGLGLYFGAELERNNVPFKSEGYITDFLTKEALKFIENNRSHSFFCYIPYNVPHEPVQVSDAYFNYYKNQGLSDEEAGVYGMVDNMDENIGILLKKLDEWDLRERTIVVFLSDNGPVGSRYNGNMKGRKGSVDEGGIRVPCFISWKGKIKPGKTQQLSQHIDLLPTLLSMCSVKAIFPKPIDGIDLSSCILKNEIIFPDRIIFSHQSGPNIKGCSGSVRSDRYRLVVTPKDTLLYNMIDDQSQSKDISKSNAQVTNTLLLNYFSIKDEVENQYYPEITAQIGYPDERIIYLPPREGKITGNIRFSCIHHNKAWFENWTDVNDSIVWEVDVVADGLYYALIEYTCEENQLGSRLKLSGMNFSVETDVDKIFSSKIITEYDRIPPAGAPERTSWGLLDMGEINFYKGKQKLVLKAMKIPSGGLCLINGIYLKK